MRSGSETSSTRSWAPAGTAFHPQALHQDRERTGRGGPGATTVPRRLDRHVNDGREAMGQLTNVDHPLSSQPPANGQTAAHSHASSTLRPGGVAGPSCGHRTAGSLTRAANTARPFLALQPVARPRKQRLADPRPQQPEQLWGKASAQHPRDSQAGKTHRLSTRSHRSAVLDPFTSGSPLRCTVERKLRARGEHEWLQPTGVTTGTMKPRSTPKLLREVCAC